MNSEILKERNKKFVLGVLALYKTLPKTSDAQIIGNQLVRVATSTPQIIELHVVPGRMLNSLRK